MAPILNIDKKVIHKVTAYLVIKQYA